MKLLILFLILTTNINSSTIKTKDFNFKIPKKCYKIYKYYKYSKKVKNKKTTKRYKKLLIRCSK